MTFYTIDNNRQCHLQPCKVSSFPQLYGHCLDLFAQQVGKAVSQSLVLHVLSLCLYHPSVANHISDKISSTPAGHVPELVQMQSWLHRHGHTVSATQSWLHSLDYTVLATQSWLHSLGHTVSATQCWLHSLHSAGYTVLATQS